MLPDHFVVCHGQLRGLFHVFVGDSFINVVHLPELAVHVLQLPLRDSMVCVLDLLDLRANQQITCRSEKAALGWDVDTVEQAA